MVNPSISLGESVIKGTKQYKSVHILLKPLEIPGHELDRPRCVVCVANGFKGPYIAGFLKTHFKDFFLKACEDLGFTDSEAEDEVADYRPVLERTMGMLNAKVEGSSKSLVQGASFTVILQAGEKVFVGNIGDSKVFAVTKSECFVVDEGHTPFNDDENHRLNELGLNVQMKMTKRKNSLCGSVETVIDDIDDGEITLTRVIGAKEFRKNQRDGAVVDDVDYHNLDRNVGTKDELRGLIVATRHMWEPKGAKLSAAEMFEAHNIGRMTYRKSKGTGLANHLAQLLTDGAYGKIAQKSKNCDSLGCGIMLWKD